MNGPGFTNRRSSPFGRFTIFAVVVVGFVAFLSMLYFISSGDTTGDRGRGQAHASATGLNGYAGLVRLLRAEGYRVTLSREPSGLKTYDLLVIAPNVYSDPDEIGEILEDREDLGPTLVILPKWIAYPPTGNLKPEDQAKYKDGWVNLFGARKLFWSERLPEPYKFKQDIRQLDENATARWSGQDLSGDLPGDAIAYSADSRLHQPLITDDAGNVLAFYVLGEDGSDYYNDAHWTLFIVEPDLVNNFGLADQDRAMAALSLIKEAAYDDETNITFDMTLNGFGGAMNLLTLAFQPPFLAATICLILAMLIIGWRAFLRFGPAAVSGPEVAFGKERLVANGAGLIVRAKRLGLLAVPYIALSERRIAQKLGLAKHDSDAIDAMLSRRLPSEEPFSTRAERLRSAQTPTEILRAAQALRELEGKLAK